MTTPKSDLDYLLEALEHPYVEGVVTVTDIRRAIELKARAEDAAQPITTESESLRQARKAVLCAR